MDMSMNMINALSIGSGGFAAQVSGSIDSPFADSGLDFNTMLAKVMMSDTGSPVPLANSANLLGLDLQGAGITGQGEGFTKLFMNLLKNSQVEADAIGSLMGLYNEGLYAGMNPDETSDETPDAAVQLLGQAIADNAQKTIDFLQKAETIRYERQSAALDALDGAANVVTKMQQQMDTAKATLEVNQVKSTVAEVIRIQAEALNEGTEAVAEPEAELQKVQASMQPKDFELGFAEQTGTPRQVANNGLVQEAVSQTAKPKQTIQAEPKADAAQSGNQQADTMEPKQMQREVMQSINEPMPKQEVSPVMQQSQGQTEAAENASFTNVLTANRPEAQTEKTEQRETPVNSEVAPLNAGADFAQSIQETGKTTQTTETARTLPYQQVKSEIEQAVSNGKDEFTMTLNPESLGKISVKLVRNAGKLTVSIIAANPQTQHLLLGQAESLAKSLGMSNIQVDGVQVQTQSSSQDQDAPVQQTTNQSFNSNVDAGQSEAREHGQGTHRQAQQHQTFTLDEGEAYKDMSDTYKMLRVQMSRLDYLA